MDASLPITSEYCTPLSRYLPNALYVCRCSIEQILKMSQLKEKPESPSDSIQTNDSKAAPPPPDGGLTAWLQVLCMHFTFFNSWGVSNSFSVFEQLYTAELGKSSSEIAWIGSVQVSLLFFLGAFAGRATDAGYFRIVYTTGAFLQVFGFFMLSLCKTYWQIFLAQAVCMGLGNGLTFAPGLAIMSAHFARHRAVAVGIAAAGAATGGLVYPVLVDQLLYTQQIGFGWDCSCGWPGDVDNSITWTFSL